MMSVKLAQFLVVSCVLGHLQASVVVGQVEDYHPTLITAYNSGDDAEVKFVLLTKDTMQNPEKVTVDDEGQLFQGKLDVSKPTKVIIHGWMDTWKSLYAQTMIASYLPTRDYNVIAVSWPEADHPTYWPSCLKVPTVGKIVGRFLDRLRNENGLNLTSVHMVAHSLGSHVAAVAGYSLGDAIIGKITALDPALPCFLPGGENTLSQKAAGFVEVVHTCGHFFGIFSEIGHVDFYPNGGVPFQPGCSLDLGCSHKRSFELYEEAIANSTAFLATACSDWKTYKKGGCSQNQQIYMSDATPLSARGKFFFRTAASPPYGWALCDSSQPTNYRSFIKNDNHLLKMIKVTSTRATSC